jgi:hypothetical protein
MDPMNPDLEEWQKGTQPLRLNHAGGGGGGDVGGVSNAVASYQLACYESI